MHPLDRLKESFRLEFIEENGKLKAKIGKIRDERKALMEVRNRKAREEALEIRRAAIISQAEGLGLTVEVSPETAELTAEGQ